MYWFIIGLLFAAIGVCALIFIPSTVTMTKNNENTGYRDQKVTTTTRKKPIAALAFGLSLLFVVLSMFAVVGARNVGVPTQFGATTGDTFDPGLNWKLPWVKVTDIDATVQPEEYAGDSCIYVKIADGGTGCVTVSYRWRINPDGADTVYADYRNSEDGITEGVRKALVSTNIKASINEVFGQYDPLDGVDVTADMSLEDLAQVKIVLPPLEEYNKEIQQSVEDRVADLGDLIDFQSVTITYFKMPETTQTKINAINAKIQDAKAAIIDIGIKTAQAKANEELAGSLKDPNVLVSKCLDGMISGEISAPAGFQCWSGTGGSVVIPGGN